MESLLTEKDHALLFGLLARRVIDEAGKIDGETIVLEAVRRYGEQRGRRMRLRVPARWRTLKPDQLPGVQGMASGDG